MAGTNWSGRQLPVTPRILTFDLEDFPEMETEARTVQGEGEQSGGGDEGERGNATAANLLAHLETPYNNAQPDSPQVTVPAHILNSIVVAQNNLSNMVRDLATKKDAAGDLNEEGEDAVVTKKELKRLLQNRKEMSDFVWELDPPFDENVAAKPYPVGYQPPHFRKV